MNQSTLPSQSSCNEQNQFIFTELRGHPIRDVKITGVDRDTDDSNENQVPQKPTHKFQATEETEEEPIIPDPKFDLNINQKTPIE